MTIKAIISFHFLLILGMLPFQNLYSQQSNGSKEINKKNHIKPKSELLAEIPFKLIRGGIILVKAKFSNIPDSLNFIFDTGGGGISLDSSLAAKYNIKYKETERYITGIAAKRKLYYLYNQKIHFQGLTLYNLDFHIGDYSLLTYVYGIPISGIVGYSFFSRYISYIDYDKKLIRVYTIGKIKYPRGGMKLPITLNTLPTIEMSVADLNSSKGEYIFDTGAGLNLMISKKILKDDNILSTKYRRFNKHAEGLGGSVSMELTIINKVQIGKFKFRKVPGFIFNDDNNILSYPKRVGILGNDLLKKFNIYINYNKKEIYIIPNDFYAEPFNYIYSGIELFKIENQIIIGHIAKDSPAYFAGLKEGDIVVCINNDFSQNFAKYQDYLLKTRKQVSFLINRDGVFNIFKLKPTNIKKKRK